MNGKSYASNDLKLLNRRSVYKFLSAQQENVFTYADIAQATALSVPTAIKIAGFFLARGLLSEVECVHSTGVGRPPAFYRFLAKTRYTAGCLFDGRNLYIYLVDLQHQVLAKDKTAVSTIDELLRQTLPETLSHLIAESALDKSGLMAVGLALPVILNSTNMRTDYPAPRIGLQTGFDFTPFCEDLSRKMGCPVFMENDVNAAALGEMQYSAMKDLVYITVGSGVGSGIILDGKLRNGSHATGGEIGYLHFNPHERIDITQGGYLERRLSIEYIQAAYGAQVFETRKHTLNRIRAAEYISDYLALVIQNISTILDVSDFVLGGLVVEAFDDLILPMIREKAGQGCLNPVRVELESMPHIASYGMGNIALENTAEMLLQD